jgi:maltooligosyltrehalose trehalohydrolase
MTTLLLLMPQTPMLFQGQEWAASSTFHYFADHNEELSRLIRAGRAREMSQFPSIATPEMQACLLDPTAEDAFRRSTLNHAEKQQPRHAEILLLHQDLLRLRRDEPTFRRVQRRGDIDGAVLGPSAFMLRFFAASDDDRLLLLNFGLDLHLDPAPEPLLAPARDMWWSGVFSSEDPRYGGTGTPPVYTVQEGWYLPGRSALVLRPRPMAEASVETRHRVAGSAQDAKVKSPS